MGEPLTTRERYRLERRLERLGRRADAARGTVMNLGWLHWFGEWQEVWERLGCPDSDDLSPALCTGGRCDCERYLHDCPRCFIRLDNADHVRNKGVCLQCWGAVGCLGVIYG